VKDQQSYALLDRNAPAITGETRVAWFLPVSNKSKQVKANIDILSNVIICLTHL